MVLLGSDDTLARRLAEELLGLRYHEFVLYPVRASRRSQARRLAKEAIARSSFQAIVEEVLAGR